MKVGDKVRANDRYFDIKEKFGDKVLTVVAEQHQIPSFPKQMVWLDCGGGGFVADGFDVVDDGSSNVLKEALEEILERTKLEKERDYDAALNGGILEIHDIANTALREYEKIKEGEDGQEEG